MTSETPSAIQATRANDPKHSSLERHWVWAVLCLSVPGLVSLGLLPLARTPFERIPESARSLVYFAFNVGLVSKHISLCAAFVALLGVLWRGVGWWTKTGLLALAGLSWLAAVHAGDVLARCFGEMHL